MRKSWEFMRMSWESCEKVMKKSWESCEKVMKKSWKSHEKEMRKLWKSHEKVVRKLSKSCVGFSIENKTKSAYTFMSYSNFFISQCKSKFMQYRGSLRYVESIYADSLYTSSKIYA